MPLPDGNSWLIWSQLDSSQDLKSTHTMVATPLNTTLPLPQSTPIKIDSSMTLPFTTHNKYCIESCTMMAVEMEKYLVGPMPVQQFLDAFFPVKKLPHLSNIPQFKSGNYNITIQAKSEINAYNPFVSCSYLITCLFSHNFFLQGKINSSICSYTQNWQFIQYP